jgi:gluconate 2-dehydrogenase gamma chain
MTSRREALKIIGAVGVTCAFPFSANELYGQHVHQTGQAVQEELKPGEPFKPQFFTPAQFLVISRLTDLILPPTDTPGAAAAGVPQYIDYVVSQDPNLQSVFQDGLRGLEITSKSISANGGFLELTEAQQVQILSSLNEAGGQKRSTAESIAESGPAFFRAIKSLTADGYYTSRIGLLQELGYNGNDYLAAFPSFSIPEH